TPEPLRWESEENTTCIAAIEPDPMVVERLGEREASHGAEIGIRRVLILLGIAVAIVVMGWQCGRYLLVGGYLDHIEGNVVISGWQYFHGAPLYGSVDGAPQLATYYGPLAYMLEVPALMVFGADIAASKLTSLSALVATVAIMLWHFRRSPNRDVGAGLLVLVTGLWFFSPMSYWVRPDPIETLLVAIGLAAAGGRWGALALGVCIGLAVNLKVHAFVYFMPVVIDLWSANGWRAVMKAAIASGVTFLVPFLAPGVSLGDYVTALALQLGRRVDHHSLRAVINLVVTLDLPGVAIAFALLSGARRAAAAERWYFLSVLATLLLLLYPSTFPGANAYHLLPAVPVLADAFSRLPRPNVVGRWSPVALFLFAAAFSFLRPDAMEDLHGARGIIAEALALAERQSDPTTQIGYGDSQRSYLMSQAARTVLALHGYPALIDAQVTMELRYIGVDGSARWIPDLVSCRLGHWLLPKGEQPFAVPSYYDNKPVFSADFRHAFLENYRRTESSGYFDVWTCAPPARG
ncbi:MAG TPA: glycosyltransferase family 87 protein, partial [Stellaceae bacterium]|nr:glycosyltransferase family 87 protein [Stellaceae bacterium]